MSNQPRRLSVGQESLWVLHRLAPESAAYNIVLAVRIRSELDTGALTAALTALTARHELLRSAFVEENGVPCRTVGPPVAPLTVTDVPDADDARLHGLAGEAGRAPFDLSAGAFRAVLLRRSTQDAVLVLITHHLAADFTSQWLLARDLFEAYRARLAGEEPAWPALTGGYDDYVEAERAMLDSPARMELADFWSAACGGAAAAELPPDRPRPATRPMRGASVGLTLAAGLGPQLRAAAAKVSATPFAVLAGAFQAVLSRHTGQDDFLIGCPVTVRQGRGRRDVVGYFANSVVLRATVEAGTTLRDLIGRVQRQTVASMARAHYPYPLLAAGSRAPLFRIAFILLSTDRLEPPLPMVAEGAVEGAEITYAGLRLAVVDVPQMEGQFDLLVEVRQGAHEFGAVFKYDPDLFDRATVERFARHYQRYVEATLVDPDTAVTAVSLVDPEEMERLMAFGAGMSRSRS